MIVVRNRQRIVPVAELWVQEVVGRILQRMRYEEFDIAVIMTNDRGIRRFNKDFRGIDRPTDILSFPFEAGRLPGKRIRALSPEERILGDLIISAPYVVRAAAHLGVSFERRLVELLVHGVYHLCGYDHVSDAQFRAMRRAELGMLRHLKGRVPF